MTKMSSNTITMFIERSIVQVQPGEGMVLGDPHRQHSGLASEAGTGLDLATAQEAVVVVALGPPILPSWGRTAP
jgi:hypothetical protein